MNPCLSFGPLPIAACLFVSVCTYQSPGAAQTEAARRVIEGRLAPGDATLAGGEYRDVHLFEGRAGDRVVVELRSTDFDPFLIVRTPAGRSFENDDFEGSTELSRIELTLPETGTYHATVTSFESGETGAYRLTLPASGAGERRIEHGRLERGDRQLSSGEYYDLYTFEGTAGERVVIDLTSGSFDTYLILRPPTGDQEDNDDFEGNNRHSRIVSALRETGTYRVQATSYAKDQIGDYVLELPAQSRQAAANVQVRRENGRLDAGDGTLRSGEYMDTFTFQGTAGERVVLDLRSDDFDPYLILRAPSGAQEENDDHDGSSSWSQIAAVLKESGIYTVRVTTYKPGATGAYEYVLTRRSADTAGPRQTVENGRLSAGDMVLRDGEFADEFPLSLTPGNRVVLDVTSADFDTYLLLRSPGGAVAHNDDHEGSTSRSRIEHVAGEAGEYTAYVTSYAKGGTGNYRLAIEIEEQPPIGSGPSDLVSIAPGQTLRGRLQSGDIEMDDRGFADVYAFEGVAGSSVAIDMRASGFDTFLKVVTPDGREIENDDFDGDVGHSRVELPISTGGRHRIYATSYEKGESGDYQVSLQPLAVLSSPSGGVGGGDTYGVFVGISEYGGRASDLAYTDRDASVVYEAMVKGAGMRSESGHLLQNSAATRGAFEAALARIAARAGARDTVVIFFSGHGGRVPRAAGPDRSDPDGKDETLEFYDRALLDDDLSALLDTVRAGRMLLVFDSCFSGGFAKDVISAPGRMGLFSSEEDVTSAVAAKFRAGGYLSVFFANSLTYADADGDGALSAIELSHYIHEQYRSQVKSAVEDYVTTGLNLGYQKLVVDRGSIGPYDVVFRRRN